jgi:hypothetical protein
MQNLRQITNILLIFTLYLFPNMKKDLDRKRDREKEKKMNDQ